MVSDLGIGLLVALVTFQTLVAYRIYADQTNDAGTASDAPTPHSPSDGLVTCPDCGAENEAGYRYCRGCVGELPGRTTVGRGRERPRGRVVR